MYSEEEEAGPTREGKEEQRRARQHPYVYDESPFLWSALDDTRK